MYIRSHSLALLLLVTIVQLDSTCRAAIRFTGTNLAGAEFGIWNGNLNLPGTYNVDYTYPRAAEVDYFLAKGMNTFRLPFRWERLQPAASGPLDAAELARLDTFVDDATSRGAYVILDPHNYHRYYPAVNDFQSSAQGLVGSDVPDAVFADLWSRLANQYKDNERVIFGLMNEPNSMPTAQLVASENAAIQAIRGTGARNLILVPGNQWTGAWHWNETWYDGANAAHMLDVVDPIDNFAFDVHQYLDHNGSGTSPQIGTNENPDNVNIGVERLTDFTNWLRTNNRKGFLGEFAVANSRIGDDPTQVGDEAIHKMLNYMEANSDVWLGWTWWAAGPWWGEYPFTLEPTNLGQPTQTDRPALALLQSHFVENLAGDYNFDGTVDAADFTVWRDSQGQTGAGLDADSNIDGVVDATDYEAWRASFEVASGGNSSEPAPEPCGIVLALIVGFLSALRLWK